MANTAQAKKRAKQNEVRRKRNASQRSTMRTAIKRVIKSVSEGKAELSLTEYKNMSSMVDKLASKGLIDKNKAARHKSRLSARIKAVTS